jgi:hypothetical protein
LDGHFALKSRPHLCDANVGSHFNYGHTGGCIFRSITASASEVQDLAEKLLAIVNGVPFVLEPDRVPLSSAGVQERAAGAFRATFLAGVHHPGALAVPSAPAAAVVNASESHNARMPFLMPSAI